MLWTRGNPYIIGLLTAYNFVEGKKASRLLVNLSLIGVFLSLIPGVSPFGTRYEYLSSPLVLIWYTSGRTIFSICLAYFIFGMLTRKDKGIMQTILESKIWIPFAKLSYGIYVFHPITILIALNVHVFQGKYGGASRVIHRQLSLLNEDA